MATVPVVSTRSDIQIFRGIGWLYNFFYKTNSYAWYIGTMQAFWNSMFVCPYSLLNHEKNPEWTELSTTTQLYISSTKLCLTLESLDAFIVIYYQIHVQGTATILWSSVKIYNVKYKQTSKKYFLQDYQVVYNQLSKEILQLPEHNKFSSIKTSICCALRNNNWICLGTRACGISKIDPFFEVFGLFF